MGWGGRSIDEGVADDGRRPVRAGDCVALKRTHVDCKSVRDPLGMGWTASLSRLASATPCAFARPGVIVHLR